MKEIRKNVLIIDDHARIRELTCELLELNGMEVLEAADMFAGIVLLDRAGAVICDGLEGDCKIVYEELLARKVEARSAFLLYSGNEEMIDWAEDKGVDYIRKGEVTTLKRLADWALGEIQRR